MNAELIQALREDAEWAHAYELGFDFVGCELDPDYFAAEEKRFAGYTAQTSLLWFALSRIIRLAIFARQSKQ